MEIIDLEKVKVNWLYSIKNNDFKIPLRFKGKRTETFKGFEKELKMAIDSIISGDSLFIHGKCGCGKTHLACGLMYVWYAQNITLGKDIYDREKIFYPKNPYFLPAVELFLELKDSFGNKNKSEDDILSEYSDIPFLVIDDIGVEKVSDWSRQIFYTLIDRRYRDMKQTIITSNLSLEELSKAIDDRIASRIVEMGKVINLGDKDMRLKK